MSTPRVILITGASGGIGRACAVHLSEVFPGPNDDRPLVLILSGRRQSELEATAQKLRQGTTAEIVIGDVSSDEDVARMFGTIKEKYGRLDVVFNIEQADIQNAGVDLLKGIPLEEADTAKFRQILEINVMSAVLCTKEAIKIMKEQSPQGGRIINNGSISASSPRPNSAPYTVSKHAIAGLTKSTSLDGRKYKITATQLDIGNAATDMAAYASAGSTQADGSIRPEPLMNVLNVAKTLAFVVGLPQEADVLSMEIIAAGMPYIGRG